MENHFSSQKAENCGQSLQFQAMYEEKRQVVFLKCNLSWNAEVKVFMCSGTLEITQRRDGFIRPQESHNSVDRWGYYS